MLKKYQLLILKRYLKAFFTIFFALSIFFTGFDVISNLERLPKSANLKVLFMEYRFLYVISFTFVLSLIFAFISAMINLIKENELVVLFSLGASKKEVLQPFIWTMSFFIFIFIFLNNQEFFVNAKQISKNIRKYASLTKYEKGLFLKYANNYIYVDKLDKFKREGKDIKIFKTNGVDLQKIIIAKKGFFKNNYWILKDVKIVTKPNLKENIINKKLDITFSNTMKVLDGFKPSIMESLYKKSQGLTIKDYIEALFLLKDKGLSINGVKANLFQAIFFPFLSIFLVIIVFFHMPIQRRGENLALVSAKFYFLSLISWGVLYILIQMSKNGVFSPEIGVLLPLFLFGIYAFYLYRKKTASF